MQMWRARDYFDGLIMNDLRYDFMPPAALHVQTPAAAAVLTNCDKYWCCVYTKFGAQQTGSSGLRHMCYCWCGLPD